MSSNETESTTRRGALKRGAGALGIVIVSVGGLWFTTRDAQASVEFSLDGDEAEIETSDGRLTDLWLDDSNTEFEVSWSSFDSGVDTIETTLKAYRYDSDQDDIDNASVEQDPDEFPDESQTYDGDADDVATIFDDSYDDPDNGSSGSKMLNLSDIGVGSQLNIIDDESESVSNGASGDLTSDDLSTDSNDDGGEERRSAIHFQFTATFKDNDTGGQHTDTVEGVTLVIVKNEPEAGSGSTDDGETDLEADGE